MSGDDDDELVLIFGEVVFVWFVARCQILVTVSGAQYCMWFWLPTILSEVKLLSLLAPRNTCVRANVSHFYSHAKNNFDLKKKFKYAKIFPKNWVIKIWCKICCDYSFIEIFMGLTKSIIFC